jgi:hypothetical protein
MVKNEPVPQNDRNIAIVCAVCHDPHQPLAHTNLLRGVFTNQVSGLAITNNQLGALYTNQVRNPFSSTNDYFLTTSDVFSNKYDPNINMCAQCHNHRGAVWTSNNRAPHHSPQYNMLLGTVGELASGLPPHQPAFHSLVEKQCVGCHMQTEEHQNGPPEIPADTGHRFTVDRYQACVQCHGVGNASGLVNLYQGFTSNRVQAVKAALNVWGLTAAPDLLRTNYGARAWEYSTPGDLSPGGSGPNTAQQALIPDNIKKARFNLYLVLYDGSYGVHNPYFSQVLLEDALNWVLEESAE